MKDNSEPKLTDEEIIKFLKEGPLSDFDRAVIDLIERQKAEIESLKAHNDSLMARSADVGKTARAFAELVKLEFYRQFDETIPSVMADRIDEVIKETFGEENETR